MGKARKTVKKSIKLINNKTIRTTKKIKNHTKIRFRKKGEKSKNKKQSSKEKLKKLTTGRLLIIDIVVILMISAMFAFIKYRRSTDDLVDDKQISIAGTWYKVDLDVMSKIVFKKDGKFEEEDLSGKKISSGSYKITDSRIALNKKTFDINYVDEKEELKDVIDEEDISEYELRKYFYTDENGKDRIYYFSNEDDASDQLDDNLLTNRYYEKSGMFDENGFAIDGEGTLLAYNGDKAEITIPSNVNCIAENAMSADYDRAVNTKKVTVPANVKKIDSGAFSFSTVDTVVIESGVEEIENWAFGDSSIKEIYFPDSIQTMHQGIFDTEEGLEGLKIHCKEGSQVEQYFKNYPPLGDYEISE